MRLWYTQVMSVIDELRSSLRSHASPAKARILAGFFQTGPGQYGEGDVFLGVTVPAARAVAKMFRDTSLSEVEELLASEFHEERLCALLLLVHNFERGDAKTRRTLYRFYLAHTTRINNWDLVDLSAPNIVGEYLLATKDPGTILVKLANSKSVWNRRIAILATFSFIKAGRPLPTLNIARMLLRDSHDLIHKAVGWMLREVGKRIDRETEEEFLRRHYKVMPRTMLRYAIERFPKRQQQAYLSGRV